MSTDVTADTSVITALKRLRLPQTQRNREFWLLLFACAISGASLTLVQLGALGLIDPVVLAIGGGLAVLAFALHIVLRLVASDADPFVLPIATLLTGLGISMIYRIDIAKHLTAWDAYSTKQLAWTAISLAGAITVVLLLRNYRVLFRYTYIFGLVGILLLLLPFVPGLRIDDANAAVWVSLGGAFAFQPGELAKISLAIFFAGYLVRNRDSLAMVGKKVLGIRFPRGRDLGPILVFWLAAMSVLVFQRDLGTSLLYFGLFLTMLYLATGRIGWIIIGVGLFLAGGLIASQTLDYVNRRFANWLDPFADPYNASHQMVQGLFGMANGGMTGTGLGQGYPDLTPLAQSDYIIPSLGEELGLIGLFVILAAYLLLVGRGLRIGFAGQDDFGKLLASGLAFTIAFQVFIVVGGVTRVIPLTGLTAPFLAAGGSSLVSNWIIIALLLLLSNSVRNRPKLVIRA
jgi:cell division protein FtsW (lipid II flippase)